MCSGTPRPTPGLTQSKAPAVRSLRVQQAPSPALIRAHFPTGAREGRRARLLHSGEGWELSIGFPSTGTRAVPDREHWFKEPAGSDSQETGRERAADQTNLRAAAHNPGLSCWQAESLRARRAVRCDHALLPQW